MGLMFDTPTFELDANNGPLITRVAIAMMVLSLVGIFLRFFSRRLVQQPFLLDDWIIIAALPLSWTICIMEIVAAKYGQLGQHVEVVTPAHLREFLKDLYAVQLLYGFSIALTKFSIMAFYRRIFNVKQTKIPLLILGSVVGAWLTATALLAIFSCTPIYEFWNRTTTSANCINTSIYYMAGAATNTFTDVVILLFPMPIIWKLQIFRSQKFSILGIFLLGGFIVLVSSLRLVAIVQAYGSEDFTWAFLPLGVWTTIETNVGIFCACIPCMRPLLRVMSGKPIYDGSTKESNPDFGAPPIHKRLWPGLRTQPAAGNNENFLWLSDSHDNMAHGTKTVISANRFSEPQELDLVILRDKIHVERKVIWSRA